MNLKNFKKTQYEEMEKIKQQQLTDKELYEKEKEDWLAQRAEIESEFKILKEKLESSRNISYDASKI